MRYFVARVTQTVVADLGTVNTTAIEPYAPTAFVQRIPTDASGVPLHDWALVAADVADVTGMAANSNIIALPDCALDTALTDAEQTALRAAIATQSLDPTAVGSTLRLTVRSLGNLLGNGSDEFSEDQFGITVP